jgi:hypothetical protein
MCSLGAMKWYYAHGGSQKGPINGDELRAKLAAGEVAKTDLVWREGMKDWVPASEVGELSTYAPDGPKPEAVSESPPAPAEQGVASVPPAQQASVAPGQSAPVSPYQAPQSPVQQGAPMPGQTPTSGKATAALVLGIIGTVFGLCGCYGMLVALPCGIIAIIFGNDVLKQVAANPALEPDRGKAKTGMILGWVGIGISVSFTILAVILGVVGNVLSSSSM